MGWEQHFKQRYFYVSRRVNGQPRREYFGRGPVAARAAEEMAERNRERALELRRIRSDQQLLQEALLLTDQLYAKTELLFTAEMTAAGYHRHDRSKWRKRHGS